MKIYYLEPDHFAVQLCVGVQVETISLDLLIVSLVIRSRQDSWSWQTKIRFRITQREKSIQ